MVVGAGQLDGRSPPYCAATSRDPPTGSLASFVANRDHFATYDVNGLYFQLSDW
jgi:hypothetical protein